MMLYYIKAKVVVKVFGISGDFTQTISKLVHAPNTAMAKTRYEQAVKNLSEIIRMQGENITFEYLEVADEIQ